jgi:hypothetical protein
MIGKVLSRAIDNVNLRNKHLLVPTEPKARLALLGRLAGHQAKHFVARPTEHI